MSKFKNRKVSALLASHEMLQSGVLGTILGTILNVAAIVLGGLAGLVIRKQPSASTQSFFKVVLGAATVYFGLRLTWMGINGSFGQCLKQLGIVLLSLSLGNLLGKLLRLQKASNRIGTLTRERMARATPQNSQRFTDGFIVCSLLFCAAPLGMLGAIHNGLDHDYFFPLAIKAVMDGLATLSFAALFGWGVILSACDGIAVSPTTSFPRKSKLLKGPCLLDCTTQLGLSRIALRVQW